MKKTATILLLVFLAFPGSLMAQVPQASPAEALSSWLGFTIFPTSGIGLSYERSWDQFSLGGSIGGWSWNSEGNYPATYANLGIKGSYKLKEWKLSSDVTTVLKAFAAIGAYYATVKQGNQSSIIDGEVGLSLNWLLLKHFSFGVDFGQTVALAKTDLNALNGFVSLPLPGFSLGVVF